jgi:hypothetical protein
VNKKIILSITAYCCITFSASTKEYTQLPSTTLTTQDTNAYKSIIDDFKKGSLKSINPHQLRILNQRKAILQKKLSEYESGALAKISKIINGSFYLGITGLLGKGLFHEGFFSPGWPYSNNIERWIREKRRTASYSLSSDEVNLIFKTLGQTLTPQENEKLAQMQQQKEEFYASTDERIKQFEEKYGKEKPELLVWDPPKNKFIEPLFNFLTGIGIITLPFFAYKWYYTQSRLQEIAIIDSILTEVLFVDSYTL